MYGLSALLCGLSPLAPPGEVDLMQYSQVGISFVVLLQVLSHSATVEQSFKCGAASAGPGV